MISITTKSDCCGCTACSSACNRHAITMVQDEEGFLYPHVDAESCIDCGVCEAVCPLLKRKVCVPSSVNKISMYAARLRDKEQLLKSASGGAFWALASYTIQKGGVVFGSVYDEQMRVVHSKSETLDKCQIMRGSKYVQSDLRGVFGQIKKLLIEGRTVLFTGCPCQVDGLLSSLRKPYRNLLTMDIVCHGVPSPKVFADYIAKVSDMFGEMPINISMRDKEAHGWGRKYSYVYVFGNGDKVADTDRVKNWGNLYFSQLINRPCCHKCPYTNIHRVADFTVGDFWDFNNLRPDIYSKDGTSLFWANTDRARAIMGGGFLQNMLQIWEISEREAMQPCLEAPPRVASNRCIFWKLYRLFGFQIVYWLLFKDSYYTRIKRKIKAMVE